MASMREIKRRRDSIESTEQITKAMKLSATVKLQKAKAKAEQSRPYATLMYRTIRSVINHSSEEGNIFLENREGKGRKAVVAVTSNRGLAGGYNQNIVRLITGNGKFVPTDTVIYAVGRKGRDAFSRKGYQIEQDYSDVINAPVYSDAADLALELMDGYKRETIGEIYLAYTSFKNTVTHKPVLLRLLPMEAEPEKEETGSLMEYEPDEETLLAAIIPGYLSSLIYSGLLEAAASEHGARMAAMDSATSNAEDMIGQLELMYNRARQGSITQELTEIIAGANAIS